MKWFFLILLLWGYVIGAWSCSSKNTLGHHKDKGNWQCVNAQFKNIICR